MKTKKFALENLAETKRLAEVFSKYFVSHARVYLSGDLGSGKTTLVQAFMKAIGYEGKVISPTFNLIKIYNVDSRIIFHIDAYRLGEVKSVFDFEDALYSSDVITFVEWPEMIEKFLDKGALEVNLTLENEIHYAQLSSEDEQYFSLMTEVEADF